MQLQLLDALDRVALLPDFRRPVAAGAEEPVQHAQEHGLLHGKLESTILQQGGGYLLADPAVDAFIVDE